MKKSVIRLMQNLFSPFGENSKNKEFEAQYIEDEKPIYAFFHIYAVNHWKDIVKELMTELHESGLYEKLTHLYVTAIVSEEVQVDFIIKQIGEKGSISFTTNDRTVYEFPALELLYEKAKGAQDFYCIYFHTKGSSVSIDTSVKEYGPKSIKGIQLLRNSNSCRRLMSYWNIKRWRLAVAVLQMGFATYGCNQYNVGLNDYIYGGNFWWARSSHIASRKRFEKQDKNSRFNAEGWLLKGMKSNIYNSYRVNCGASLIEIPPMAYSGKGFYKLLGLMKAYINHIKFSYKEIQERKIFK